MANFFIDTLSSAAKLANSSSKANGGYSVSTSSINDAANGLKSSVAGSLGVMPNTVNATAANVTEITLTVASVAIALGDAANAARLADGGFVAKTFAFVKALIGIGDDGGDLAQLNDGGAPPVKPTEGGGPTTTGTDGPTTTGTDGPTTTGTDGPTTTGTDGPTTTV